MLVLLYVVVYLISNISSLRMIVVLAFTMDAGTLLYPITFRLRDMIHKKAGKDMAIFTIIAAAGLNLFMFIAFYVVAILPADMRVGPQTTFGEVLLPGIRIVAGSIVAMILAEFLDTAIYAAVAKKLGAKFQWARVAISNAFSVPVDSIIFTLIAFYGLIPAEVIGGVIVSNIIIKLIVSAFSIGKIYRVKEDKM